MSKGRTNKQYTPEFKIQVVETMREEKLSYREAERKYGLSNDRVRFWERIYLEEGPEGFRIEENAYLKKLNALVLEEERQSKRRK